LSEISWDDFEKVDVRVGTVVEAEHFPEARKPSIKLMVDFGPEVGTRKTSAQLTAHYEPEGLVGKQVVAVINFPPKRIAGFESEVLVLGVPDRDEDVVLLSPDHEVPPGGRMF
jgi:tRNA-binding protein